MRPMEATHLAAAAASASADDSAPSSSIPAYDLIGQTASRHSAPYNGMVRHRVESFRLPPSHETEME